MRDYTACVLAIAAVSVRPSGFPFVTLRHYAESIIHSQLHMHSRFLRRRSSDGITHEWEVNRDFGG